MGIMTFLCFEVKTTLVILSTCIYYDNYYLVSNNHHLVKTIQGRVYYGLSCSLRKLCMNISLPEIHIDLVKPRRPAAFLIGLFLIAFVAALDYLTGNEVSLAFLYLFPVAFATWYV